ncbi:MAG: sigma-70 family RNA polymerase sigma factor, partial [Chthoniobacterales bacterium]|nr:sigma-70 family RNA polymerase sigma factor [Chthoniobacterales bacterium]
MNITAKNAEMAERLFSSLCPLRRYLRACGWTDRQRIPTLPGPRTKRSCRICHQFATTHWSVVLTAQGESVIAREALERLCRTYWWPLYGFVRRQGYTPEEAQDFTQDFFALLLERKDLDGVRQEKGRLRSYLLASLKNFLAKAHRRAMAVKRGGGRPLVPLEELLARERADLEPADTLSADRIYERRWALRLLEQVLARLEEEYRTAGNAALFEQLKRMLA